MKRFLFSTGVLFIAMIALAQDVIVTTDAQTIKAKITEVHKSEIRYKELDNLDGPTFVLSTEEISTITYANGKMVVYNQPANVDPQRSSTTINESTVEILLLDGQKITAQIKDLRSEYVGYIIDGKYSTIAASRIEKVTFLQNGQVKTYNEKAPVMPVITNQPQVKHELNLAKVSFYSGVYVFTDCIPVGEYEVLGDVYFDKEGKTHARTLMYYNAQSKSINSSAYTYTETPQYPDIRDGLVAQAIMANRQVEGVLIDIPKEGEGRATLIKFKDGVEDKSLARVNSHLGIFVFTDCTPVNIYTFVGKINYAGGLNSDYNVLRDRLIKKAKKKFSYAQGIIPRFVSGGYDSAEIIKF